jgi:hypothetical protein
VLLSGYFGDPTDPRLIPGSVSIELVHLATLYHDDVIDEADSRHGVAAANVRWNNTVAILTGDYLFARASEISTDLGTDICALLARTIATLCDGQIREDESRGARRAVTVDATWRSSRRKMARSRDVVPAWERCSPTRRPSPLTSSSGLAGRSGSRSSCPTTSWTSPPRRPSSRRSPART